MDKMLSWALVLTMPPMIVAAYYCDDASVLKFLALLWGFTVFWEALGWVLGFIAFKSAKGTEQ